MTIRDAVKAAEDALSRVSVSGPDNIRNMSEVFGLLSAAISAMDSAGSAQPQAEENKEE